MIEATTEVKASIAAFVDALPVQAIHGDATDDNVVGPLDAAGRVRPDGVIDFGDLVRSWRIGELAVTCCSILHHRPDDAFAVLHAIRAFDARVRLTDAEIAVLWPLMVLRGAVLVASGEHQARLDPDNPSVMEPLENEWRMFSVARSVMNKAELLTPASTLRLNSAPICASSLLMARRRCCLSTGSSAPARRRLRCVRSSRRC